MRKLLFPFIIVVVFIANVSFAQNKAVTKAAEETISVQNEDSYPIDPRPFLEWGTELARKARADNPNFFKDARAKRTTSWNYNVGDTHSFWGQKLDGSNDWYLVPSTCKAVGTNCYVFVEDAMWTNGRMNQTGVDAIVTNFDNNTPASSTKGIYQTLNEVYGDPPDLDNDQRIIILVHDIIDGYSGTGGYVGGYFWSYHENPVDATFDHSNEAEMLFVDCNPAVLTDPSSVTNAMDVVAHEFQHMINWNYNPTQMTFFDEGCSMVAEHICGYPFREQSSYANETNHYLLDWRDGDNVNVLTDYSRAARFMLYMYEQFGNDFMTRFVQSPSTGTNGIDFALANMATPTSRRFNDAVIDNNIFIDWLIANSLDNKAVNPKWGYNLSGLTKPVPREHPTPNANVTDDRIEILGAQYISFTGGSNLTVNFAAQSSNIIIRALKIGDNNQAVEEVTRGVDYNVADFGTTYHTVTFLVSNRSSFGYNNISYTATGTGGSNNVEIIYDSGEPVQALNLEAGSRMSVYFDGVPGTTIRRINVALLNSQPIEGRIYRYSGSQQPSPLGDPLSDPFYLQGTQDLGDPPFPSPFPNWAEYYAGDDNIDASTDFSVVFEYTGEGGNNVIASLKEATERYHSDTYLTDQNPPGWFYLNSSANPGNIWLYMIRATVTYDITGVEEEIELLPKSFVLDQNYPNPFNPSTTIRFQLPEHSDVTVKVYDMIGREIATLVNDAKPAGSYEVHWNGRNYSGHQVSSGVYFYTISTKDFVQSKKMVLMK